jgi:hypothetical protein
MRDFFSSPGNVAGTADLNAKAEVIQPAWADFSMPRIDWNILKLICDAHLMQPDELIRIATALSPDLGKAWAVKRYVWICLRAKWASRSHSELPVSHGLHEEACMRIAAPLPG